MGKNISSSLPSSDDRQWVHPSELQKSNGKNASFVIGTLIMGIGVVAVAGGVAISLVTLTSTTNRSEGELVASAQLEADVSGDSLQSSVAAQLPENSASDELYTPFSGEGEIVQEAGKKAVAAKGSTIVSDGVSFVEMLNMDDVVVENVFGNIQKSFMVIDKEDNHLSVWADLNVGDIVVSVSGYPIESWEDMEKAIRGENISRKGVSPAGVAGKNRESDAVSAPRNVSVGYMRDGKYSEIFLSR